VSDAGARSSPTAPLWAQTQQVSGMGESIAEAFVQHRPRAQRLLKHSRRVTYLNTVSFISDRKDPPSVMICPPSFEISEIRLSPLCDSGTVQRCQ